MMVFVRKSVQVVLIRRVAILVLLLMLAAVGAVAQSAPQAFEVNTPFDAEKYRPLEARERWQRWWREDGAGPAIHVQSLTTALYLQTINDPTVWNRTPGGFIRRLGSSYGGNLIQNSVHESFAGIEGTDPRYFACGCRGFFHRTGHALKMTFLTYNRHGGETLDIPQFTAAYGSSMIEAAWWPNHYSALVQGVQTGHIEVGFIGAVHLAQEFSPEFKRWLHLRGSAKP